MSQIGYGTRVAVNDGAANAFVDVADLVNIDIPDEVLGRVESKRLDLPSRVITSIPGLVSPGELTFEYEYTKAAVARFNTLKSSMANKAFRVTIPDAAGVSANDYIRTVPGFIMENKAGQIVDETIITYVVKVAITGPAT